MKIKNIVAATAVTAWSGMACAGFTTTFGQNKNVDALFPLTFYPEAVAARDNFLASVGGAAGFFDFESEAVNLAGFGATTVSANLGGVQATLVGGEDGAGVVRSNLTGGSNMGRYSVSGVSDEDHPPPQGNRYWEVTAPTSGVSSFTMNFDKAVQSFGFFATDVGDKEGTLSLVLTLDDCTTNCEVTIQPGGGGVVQDGDPVLGDGAAGSVLFFGVSTSLSTHYFKSVRFISSGGSTADIFGFDMFTVVAAPGGPSPTPLPGSLALVGAALGGLALVRRRR